MAKLCDICGVPPATVCARVTTSDGDTEMLDLCETDYHRLARQQRSSSPPELLSGSRGSLFEDFFGSTPSADRPERITPAAAAMTRGRRSGHGDERRSKQAKDLLLAAAQKAAELGRRQVDTEHLLPALTESEVVRTTLGQFKISVGDLRRQVEEEAPHGGKAEPGVGEECARQKTAAREKPDAARAANMRGQTRKAA
jgi:ATP-dependent Clp protease ATP-binding subunit ClpC